MQHRRVRSGRGAQALPKAIEVGMRKQAVDRSIVCRQMGTAFASRARPAGVSGPSSGSCAPVLQGRTSFRSPPSPQQRHAVLDSVDGPARRAHGAVRASSSFRIRSSRTASSSPCSFSISSNRHSFAAILAGRLGLGGLKPPRPWRPQASGCARPAGPVRRYGRQGRLRR
jgi:hypothetical protein